jgi:hypothetical protein
LAGKRTWPSPFSPALRNYKQLIKTKWRLVPNLSLNKPYDFRTLEEFEKFDRQSFADSYPDSWGCVMLAPVGFNEQRSIAILFIARVYPGYGAGNLFALEKKDNEWSRCAALSSGCGWHGTPLQTMRKYILAWPARSARARKPGLMPQQAAHKGRD